MAKRRRPSIQMPDPTTMTEAAIDAGVRAVEMTASLARGFARGGLLHPGELTGLAPVPGDGLLLALATLAGRVGAAVRPAA